jgi:hypothetical protein
MKEQEFDHIIKQKLEGISNEPPAYMWSKIAAAIPPAANTPVASTGLSGTLKIVLLAASAVIIGGLSFLLLQKNDDVTRPAVKNTQYSIEKINLRYHKNTAVVVDSEFNETKSLHSVEFKPSLETLNVTTNNKKIISNNNPIDNSDQDFDSAFGNTTKSSAVKPKLKTTEPQKENSVKTQIKKQPVSLKLAVVPQISNEQEPTGSNSVLQTEARKKENQPTPVVESTKLLIEEVATVEIPQEEVEVEVNEPNAIEDDSQATEKLSQPEPAVAKENPKTRQLNKYGIGIHYGPEFMDVDNFKLTDQAVDLSFNYQNMNFIIQTGLGVRYSEDQATYDIKYKRWEYWKTQIRFDSASLYIGPNGDTIFQPANVYYEEIYDSLNHSYQATAKEHYTILQIPILLGYQIDYDKFAIFIKGGIRYSLIAYQQNDDLFIPDENSRITDYNYPIKTRAKSNIDYELSLGGAYKINKHFQIQAEAFGRYYHYSIYEENPPSGIHPWSLSLRAGLVYIF